MINVPSFNGDRQRCILWDQQGCRLQQRIPLEWITQHQPALFGIRKRQLARIRISGGCAQQNGSGSIPQAFELIHPIDPLKARPLKQQAVSIKVCRQNIQALLSAANQMDGRIFVYTHHEGG